MSIFEEVEDIKVNKNQLDRYLDIIDEFIDDMVKEFDDGKGDKNEFNSLFQQGLFFHYLIFDDLKGVKLTEEQLDKIVGEGNMEDKISDVVDNKKMLKVINEEYKEDVSSELIDYYNDNFVLVEEGMLRGFTGDREDDIDFMDGFVIDIKRELKNEIKVIEEDILISKDIEEMDIDPKWRKDKRLIDTEMKRKRFKRMINEYIKITREIFNSGKDYKLLLIRIGAMLNEVKDFNINNKKNVMKRLTKKLEKSLIDFPFDKLKDDDVSEDYLDELFTDIKGKLTPDTTRFKGDEDDDEAMEEEMVDEMYGEDEEEEEETDEEEEEKDEGKIPRNILLERAKRDDDVDFEFVSENIDKTKREIDRAYRKKSLLIHPDRFSRRSPQFINLMGEEFKRLLKAYEILTDNII